MKAFHSYFLLLSLLFCLSSLVGANDNCATEVNGTCTACLPGFTMNSSNNCTCATPNCQNCSADSNNNSICAVCSMYFGTKTSDMSLCKSCYLDGCNNCSLSTAGLPTCTNCTLGYYLEGGQCKSCSDVAAGCSNCSKNGAFKCHNCSSSLYYSNGTSCVTCGADNTTANCSTCSNHFSAGYCYSCNENLTMTTSEGGSCNSCSLVFPHCSECSKWSKSCYTCEDGYYANYVNGVMSCDLECTTIANCSQCPSNSSCLKCKSGYFLNFTSQCELCSDAGTVVTNCLKPTCSNESSVIEQDCEVCNAGFINLNANTDKKGSCVSCSQNITNCAECSLETSSSSLNYAECSKCKDGYKRQLEVNESYTCVQNCSSTHFWYNNYLCVPCTKVAGNYCDSCNQTYCFSCKSPSYALLNKESNMTCSLCQNNDTDSIVTQSNKTFCSRKTKAAYKDFNTSNGTVSFNLSCQVAPSKVVFVYGPATLVDALSLQNDVTPKVGSKNQTNIPSTSDTEWIGYGSRIFDVTNATGNYTTVSLIPPLKASGESFKARIWCESLLNSSDVSNTTITWTQPNNGGKKTKLSVNTNTQLTASQKQTLGYAIKKALKITREMYTDLGDLVPNTITTSARLLQTANATTYANTFVVIPDYTASVDNSATLINQTVQDSATFLASVNAVLASVTTNSSFAASSVTATVVDETTVQPVLANVNLNMNGNTLKINFNLTNANGTFYAGAESTTYGLVLANLSSANLNYPNWNLFLQGKNYSSNTLAHFSNVTAVAGKLSEISLANFETNKTYLVYYGAASNEIPAVYTQIYVNVTNTIQTSGGDGSNSASRICSYLCLIGLLLFAILN